MGRRLGSAAVVGRLNGYTHTSPALGRGHSASQQPPAANLPICTYRKPHLAANTASSQSPMSRISASETVCTIG